MSRALIIFSLSILFQSKLGIADPLGFGSKFSSHRDIELGYRLPNDTRPIRYDITLTTHIHLDNLDRFGFEGEVHIDLHVLEPTSKITLHYRAITILDADLTKDGEIVQSWNTEEVERDTEREFLLFNLMTEATVGEAFTLRVSYKGVLRSFAGFYRSSYVASDGSRRWLATTQFESTDARHAFPCYDEPGVRAVYGITIIHGNSRFAISNTPVKTKEASGIEGYTKTVFEDTPNMQTYLLAWVISDFTYVQVHSKVPQRVFAAPHDIERGVADYGVRVGTDVLKYLDAYFGISYGENIKKLDQIGIPDFEAGAMENWGLVTYAEPYLLYDATTDDLNDKHEIAATIAHEYVHQYFGNLVSPVWWDYLWLNEGFATMYEHLALTPLYPEFNDDELFLVRILQRVMETDGYGVTRAMTHYVEHPDDIEDLFDSVAYPKSGSVLYTWRNAIGESTWAKGLNYYLTDMALKSSDSKDLARGLQKAVDEDNIYLSGLTMEDIVEQWSRTPGFPVIYVSLTDNNKLHFNQNLFQYSSNQPRNTPLWNIPISIASASQHDFSRTQAQFWMSTETHIQHPEPMKFMDWEENDWILVNLKQSGYYRVNYEPKLWLRLINKLNDNHEDIHHASRAGLLNDAFNLARAELLDYITVFRLLSYLHHETHFQPWSSVDAGITYIDRLLLDTETYPMYQTYIRTLIASLYDHYGLRDNGNSESFGDKLARSIAIKWACRTGYGNCREHTSQMMKTVTVTKKDIANDLQNPVYCAGSRALDAESFHASVERIQEFTHSWSKLRLIRGLGCAENTDNQEFYMKTLIDGESDYSSNEAYYLLNSVYSNSKSGLETAISFIHENANELRPYGWMDLHVQNIARLVSSEEHLNAYKELLLRLRGINLITAQQYEDFVTIAELNLRWISHNEEDIEEYLKEFFKTGHGHVPMISGIVLGFVVMINFFLM